MPAKRQLLCSALALGGMALVAGITTAAAGASQSGERENTAICGECTHRIEWGGAERVQFYEVFVADPEAEDGRRLAYKGPRSSIYITVHGDQTVLVRACNSAGCSGLFPIPLTAERDYAAPPVYRSSEPLYFLSGSDSPATPIGVGWPTFEHRSVVVDISATRQQVCGPDPNEPWWYVGTRLLVRLSADVEFVATNRHIVEHDDGSWTWTGDITGDHKGTMQFTTDACGESVYASIDSDVGLYVVQPSVNDHHIAYRVEPGDRTPGCAVLTGVERFPLLDISENSVDLNRRDTRHDTIHRSGNVEVDFPGFESRYRAITYIVGDDRHHDVASFVQTSVFVEFFDTERLGLDLHRGDFWSNSSDRWGWRGCVVGEASSQARIEVHWPRRDLNVTVQRDHRYLFLQPGRDDSYQITDQEVYPDRLD